MDEHEIHALFLRQRRNLIGISLIIFFVTFSGIHLSKLNFLGNELEIGRPYFINVGLWLAYFYWLARYIQYLIALGDKNIHSSYARYIFARTLGIANTEFDNRIVKQYEALESTVSSFSIMAQNMTEKASFYNPFHLGIIQIQKNFVVRNNSGTGKNAVGTHDIKPQITRRHAISLWLKALLRTFVIEHYGSEYLLPPLLASAVLIACLIEHYVS